MTTHEQGFSFPLHTLENDKVRLDIFDPSIHAEPFVRGCQNHPSIWSHVPMGPFPTTQSFIDDFYTPRITQTNGTCCLFAILDKLSDETTQSGPPVAGIVGYLNTSAQHLKTELGFVITLPEFQRTHVTSNACGLLIRYALDLPKDGGLGLRRLTWQANSHNAASRRAAERLGFIYEGTLRWDRIFGPDGRGTELDKRTNGIPLRKGDPRSDCAGRDSLMLAICWDDWELGGVKEKVDEVMKRTS